MRQHWKTLWTFKTARFTVRWQVADCFDLDLSWDETGETRENLASGLWTAFDSRVVILLDGRAIGEAHLGQSIYENPSDFRDHIGRNAEGYGSYFSDMIREAIGDARATLSHERRTTPRMRAA